MTRQLIVAAQCDTCGAAANHGFIAGAALEELASSPVLRLVDACDECAEPWQALIDRLAALPAWQTAAAQTAAGSRHAETADPRRLCKLCGQGPYTSGQTLADHVWIEHATGTPRPAAPLTCPECGKTFGSTTGTGSHRRRAHGYSAVAAAYAAAAAEQAAS